MGEPIFSYIYSNGLVLVAEPMPWLHSAAFTMLLPAGTAQEPPDRGGLSSLTAEMAFRGAGPRNSRQFLQDLEALGIEWSQSVSDAHSSYSAACEAEKLPQALELFADLLRRPHLPKEELEAARQTVLQECRSLEDEPAQKVVVELRRRYYRMPWGRPSQGELKALQIIRHQEVVQFWEKFYRPDGCIIGVAGRVDWQSLVNWVGELFADWLPGAPSEPLQGINPPCVGHHCYESQQTHLAVVYPTVPYRHEDYFRAWSAVHALSGGASARLFREIRERRGLCYAISASYHSLRNCAGVFCYAGTTAERAQETLDVLLSELNRLSEGLLPEELHRLRARVQSALVFQQESSTARSQALAADWYHLGRARTLDELGQMIQSLSLEEINAYLAQCPPKDFSIFAVGPKPLQLPETQAAQTVL
ncbi:MAG: insulinase family protein [Thermoguttaceae bacterium]|nr:insulinase family protein [Thermoguttaceae bacterium]MDW8038359.1 pitrilysin family protein [Thermoguttaceae bacterium]